jgi:hypothetical protein
MVEGAHGCGPFGAWTAGGGAAVGLASAIDKKVGWVREVNDIGGCSFFNFFPFNRSVI